jgi:hypothetical protein
LSSPSPVSSPAAGMSTSSWDLLNVKKRHQRIAFWCQKTMEYST